MGKVALMWQGNRKCHKCECSFNHMVCFYEHEGQKICGWCYNELKDSEKERC